MEQHFSHIMSNLRKSRGISQRRAAGDLHISQALLSHYENGVREPGLAFVCRACDYYGVTADYLLGRNTDCAALSVTEEATLCELIEELRSIARRAEETLSGIH